MDCNTGKIYLIPEDQVGEFRKKFFEENARELLPLDEKLADELEPLSARRRKGFMRNKPCVCGSGKKFKRCCWSKYL